MASLKFRVVSYNVLSSSLCSTSYFTFCPEKFCSSKYRYDGLLQRLTKEVDSNSIICLQEVSLSWAASLHTFFEARNYTLVVSNYGHRFNGYMGIAVAFPRSEFALASCDITCISDSKSGGWQIPKTAAVAPTATTSGILALIQSFPRQVYTRIVSALQVLIWGKPTNNGVKEKSLWEGCRQRSNTMVTLRLSSKHHGTELPDFLVATYHMPCQFRDIKAMEIYALMCFQKLQSLSEGGKYLYVLGGDFNFKPDSSQYVIATTGELAEEHPPKLYETDTFEYRLKLGGMKSAYKEAWGKEPEFTNYASTEGKEVFQGVLDYIFFSPQANKHKGKRPKLACLSADELPCEEVKQFPSLPNETEFSDHLLIAAEFELTNSE